MLKVERPKVSKSPFGLWVRSITPPSFGTAKVRFSKPSNYESRTSTRENGGDEYYQVQVENIEHQKDGKRSALIDHRPPYTFAASPLITIRVPDPSQR